MVTLPRSFIARIFPSSEPTATSELENVTGAMDSDDAFSSMTSPYRTAEGSGKTIV